MSTQPNVLSDKANALIGQIKAGVEERVKGFATIPQLDGLKAFVEQKMAENLQAIIDSHKAPIIGSKKWVVRNPRTKEKHEMEYSLGRVLWVLQQRKAGVMPREKVYAHEVEYVERTITEGTAGAGGTLIPQEWTDFVIPELGARVVFMKANPNVLPMQHQILNIPGLTNNASYTWLGENAPISESAPSTNNTPLTLHTLKGLTGVSVEWLRDATPETDAALQANLVRGASRAVDLAMFEGTGGGTQPTGLQNISGIGTSVCGGGSNGATPTTDDVSTSILGLDQANAPEDGRTWFCHPRTVDRFRKLKNTLGDPILWVNPANALEMRLNGYPIYTTTQIPINQSQGSSNVASTLFLVAMGDMFVGQGIKSQGLEVAISEEALFTSAEVAVRLLYRTDLQPGHAVSVYALTGVL